MVDLELYRIFKIVADEENLTRASEKLNISQPAVTKHIQNLENELNLKLFDRTKYGIKLTSDGIQIYSQIKNPINILINVEKSIKQIKVLNLGININIPKTVYSPIINNIKEKNLGIDINLGKAPTEYTFQMLENGELDAYLSKKQPDELHDSSISFIQLGTFHDDFFVNINSKYRDKNIINTEDSITIYTLRKISSTYQNLERIINQNKLSNIDIKDVTLNTILEKMQNNDIIAYITEEYIQEELKSGKIKRIDLGIQQKNIEYGIYYNSKNKIKNIKRIINNILK